MTSKNILVVDDEGVNHLLYQKMLNSFGWSNAVCSAYDGIQALEILQQRCRQNLAIPDLILLDLHMPRMNGEEFIIAMQDVECLKGKREKIVIAVVSASMDQAEFERVRLLGVRHICSKPLDKPQLELISRIEFNEL